MSRKPLLSESQVAKWMKLANIDKNATKNFLNESKSNKKVLKENYGMNSSPMGAREDEDMGEEDGGMDIGDGSMGEEPSVVGDEEMDMVNGLPSHRPVLTSSTIQLAPNHCS